MAEVMNEFSHETNQKQALARQEIAEYVATLEQELQELRKTTPERWAHDENPSCYDSDNVFKTGIYISPAGSVQNVGMDFSDSHCGASDSSRENPKRRRRRPSSDRRRKLPSIMDQAAFKSHDDVGDFRRKQRGIAHAESQDSETASVTSLESQESRDDRRNGGRGSRRRLPSVPDEGEKTRNVVATVQRDYVTQPPKASAMYRKRTSSSRPRRSRQDSGLGESLCSLGNSLAVSAFDSRELGEKEVIGKLKTKAGRVCGIEHELDL